MTNLCLSCLLYLVIATSTFLNLCLINQDIIEGLEKSVGPLQGEIHTCMVSPVLIFIYF